MTYDKRKLFIVSLLALVTAGISFALRASVGSDLQATFFNNSGELVGSALGVAGLGFALTIAIGSPMLDYLGMGNLLTLSSLCFMAGTLTVTLYPEEKTSRLNILHAWWPGGIIMGGLIGLALGQLNMHWKVKLGMV